MKKKACFLLVVGIALVSVSFGQVMAPNAVGVFAAHEHLTITDLDSSRAFWTALGGEATQVATMNGVRFPGIYILLQANRGRGGRNANGAPAAQASAPPPAPASSVGSVAEAIGIKVKNLHETLSKLDTLGIRPEPGATATHAAVMSPAKVKVLLTEDPALATAAASDELLMRVSDPAAAAAWYARWFGASVVTDGKDSVAKIPGMNMRFVATSTPAAGTKGRALDHIGFDVHNLQDLVTKMQAAGVTVNTPYRAINFGFLTGIAFVTDPWGTYIELNEGYDGH
jgi:catechol 2,3-dioxygenase-like lactoylglutathione lyase family enzyme